MAFNNLNGKIKYLTLTERSKVRTVINIIFKHFEMNTATLRPEVFLIISTFPDFYKVWMPDTFFRNEKEAKFHDIIQPNLYVRVFPNGDVLYSIRVRCQENIKFERF